MSAASTTNIMPEQAIHRPSRFLRISAWVSFVLNVVIIATGGAVRLTGSGLGCSEWPLCTPDSLVTTPEMGIHGIIEFGNRTISGPLLLFAILVVVLSWRIRSQRRDLFILSVIVFALVALQALIGGFVVGVLVVVGWYVTGDLGADDFDPVPLESITFVAPVGETIQYVMIATGIKPGFGVLVVCGVVLGALAAALLSRRFEWQGFQGGHRNS